MVIAQSPSESNAGNPARESSPLPASQEPGTNLPGPPPPSRLRALLELLRQVFLLMTSLRAARRRRRRKDPPPWHVRIGQRAAPLQLSESEISRLIQRQRDLMDMQKIAETAARYRLPESDFFADPEQVERLIRYLLEANPPWLRVSRALPGSEPGASRAETEYALREHVTREMQDVTLFVPDDAWRDLPLASLTLRPARTLQEVWQARLLDQVLPPEVLLDKRHRGEILIPIHHRVRQRLEFLTEQRRIEVTIRKPVAIPIEMEEESGAGGQILYILLDYSASMRGKSATLAMAVIAATLRANMGQKRTRYLFRRYAEETWPPVLELPAQARTLQEKDALVDTILATNFNGAATHVNDALEVAIADIEHLRREEHLEASILLVTDGRAELWESTRLRLAEARVKVHSVMVTPERNPGLEVASESFTALDIHLHLPHAGRSRPAPLPAKVEPRRSFRI